MDNRIWFRNYQIVEQDVKGNPLTTEGVKTSQDAPVTLVEIGPRFAMNPIRIFDGSFGGPIIYENPHFVSPNDIRSAKLASSASKYAHRVQSEQFREYKNADIILPRTELDEVDDVFRKEQ